MGCVHRSFVREILKVTEDPEIISFAGGLPNPRYFPVHEVALAAQKVLSECGEAALQYSTTEGYLPLREMIAERYARRGVKTKASEILITNGSQQGLDLFNRAIKEKVAFVPGQAFYADGGGSNTMRLNFSNSDNERIFEGITRLEKVIKEAAS
jgi:DNA-binding transcriptional MocR family regulator